MCRHAEVTSVEKQEGENRKKLWVRNTMRAAQYKILVKGYNIESRNP